jgi:hypothetical protein
MKKQIIISLLAVMACLPDVLNAQNSLPGRPLPRTEPQPLAAEGLPRFALNFTGGTPEELQQAIQHTTGQPLNVIIQEQDKKVWIPPLKMNGVTVPELFYALSQANSKQVTQVTGKYFGGINGQSSSQYTIATESYGFRTSDNPVTDHSIWYFYHVVPPRAPDADPEQVCRYFQLGPFLETYKVEDITTAIETGWKMLPSYGGQPNPNLEPRLSFHKDTKLLIAVGEPEKLKLIDSVLEQLRPNLKDVKNKPTGRESQPPAKSGEADKP